MAESRMVRAAIDTAQHGGNPGHDAGRHRRIRRLQPWPCDAPFRFQGRAVPYCSEAGLCSLDRGTGCETSTGKTGLRAITTAIDSHLAHALRHPEYIRAQNILWGAALDPSSEFKPNVTEFMRIQRESVADWVKGRPGKAEKSGKDINADRIGEQFYGGLIGINQPVAGQPRFRSRGGL